jgi:hypothetical protein
MLDFICPQCGDFTFEDVMCDGCDGVAGDRAGRRDDRDVDTAKVA